MKNETPTIFIIDDDLSVRRSLSLFLTAAGYNVEVYSSAEEYLERETYNEAGCIILDVNLEGKSGLELQEILVKRELFLPIIFITGKGNIRMSVDALKKGAINFLEKPFNQEELLKSISEALLLSSKINTEKKETRIAMRLIETLTPREFEVCRHLLSGILNKQIAHELNIAEPTVKIHRRSISEKLGVKSIQEIMRIADKAGVVPIDNKYL